VALPDSQGIALGRRVNRASDLTPARAGTPPEVLAARWEAVSRQLSDANIDCLLVGGRGAVGDYGDVCFLTGVPLFGTAGPAYVVLSPGSTPQLLVRERDVSIVGAFGPCELIVTDANGRRGPGAIASAALRRVKPGMRIGLVGAASAIPAAHGEMLYRFASEIGSEVVDGTDLLGRVKAQKTPFDMEVHRLASRIADQAFEAFLATLYPGVPITHLIGAVECAARQNGALASIVQVRTGRMDVSPPSFQTIDTGSVICCVAEVVGPNGYWSEKGGMFVIGSVRDEVLALIELYERMFRDVSSLLRPGVKSCDVARAAHEWDIENSFIHVGETIGHGVGIDSDLPSLESHDPTPLQGGMSIALHPHVSRQNTGAFAIEQFTVGEDGPVPHSRLGLQTYRL
jgi:Xaa-Pro aminopeptidase